MHQERPQGFRGLQAGPLRGLVLGLFLASNFIYLVWRVTSTLHPGWLVYSLLFLAAEVYGFCSSVLFYYLLEKEREPPPPPAMPERLPSVDVFIATYNEDPDLVRTTARAARDMELPHQTWILDDGRREAMAQVARELGVGYLTRDDNAYFKSGNLNAAMARTEGEIILVLDADCVPRRTLLQRTLGYLADPGVGMVQLPQVFYNTDSFQHEVVDDSNLLYHEASLFHHRIQDGAGDRGAAFCVGTGALFKREALEQIGGFATGTITEDIHTSMRLQDAGWQVAYRNEALASLLAPSTPLAYHTQRLRWSQGAMQILRWDPPWRRKGLTGLQRLLYTNSLASSLSAIPNLVLYLAPAAFLLLDMTPIAIGEGFRFPILVFLVHIAIDLTVFRLLASPQAQILLAERYKMLNCPIHLRGALRLLRPTGLTFQVTPKGWHSGLPMDMVGFLVGMVALNLVAVSVGITRAVLGHADPWVAALTGTMALFFTLVALDGLYKAWIGRAGDEDLAVSVCMHTRSEHDQRFFPLYIDKLGPKVVEARAELEVGTVVRVDLQQAGIERLLSMEVVHEDQGRCRLEVEPLSTTERDQLERFLFDTAFPDYLRSFVDAPSTPPGDPVLPPVDEPDEPVLRLVGGA